MWAAGSASSPSNSANTRHLWEICARHKPSFLVHGPEDVLPAWLEGVEVLGVTAGASTPDYLIEEVEEAARALRGEPVRA